MKSIFGILVLLVGCGEMNSKHPAKESLVQSSNQTSIKYIEYANTKYGFGFQYPAAWRKEKNETEAIDRKGNITSVEINFADTISNSSLLVVYHLPPKGADIFKYQQSQFNLSAGWYKKNAKQITVAGTKAIQATFTITKDGKGNTLQQPLRRWIVDFPDAKQNGEFQLQFTTLLLADSSVTEDLNKILSGFKFLNSK